MRVIHNPLLPTLQQFLASDIADIADLQTTLDAKANSADLGELATLDLADISGNFATAAQGILADSALQPGDNISTLTNDSGFITDYTVTEADVVAHEDALTLAITQVTSLQTTLDGKVDVAGDTMSGDLTVNGTVTSDEWTDGINSIATFGGRTTFRKSLSGVTEFGVSPFGTKTGDNAVVKIYGTDYGVDATNWWALTFDTFGSAGGGGQWSGMDSLVNDVAIAPNVGGTESLLNHDMVFGIGSGAYTLDEALRFVAGTTPAARFFTNVLNVLASGRVGVGTTSPSTLLSLGDTNYTFTDSGLSFGDGDTGFYEDADDSLIGRIGGSDAFAITSNGIGLGTSDPQFAVEMLRTDSGTSNYASTFSIYRKTSGDMVDGFGSGIVFFIEDSANVKNNIAGIGAERDGADGHGKLIFRTSENSTSSIVGVATREGNWGLGVEVPEARLHVVADNIASGTGLLVDGDGETGDRPFVIRINTTPANATDSDIKLLFDYRGYLSIGHASPTNMLDVAGTIQADGLRLDVTPTAETPSMTHTITISINGTNYKLPCAPV